MANDNINVLINQLKKMRNDWPKAIESVGKVAANAAVSKSVEEMLKEFRPNFDKYVDEFYASSHDYDRRGSMYNILKIKSNFKNNQADVSVDFDDSAMTFREGGTGLMELTFGLGYHGGAKSSKPDRKGRVVSGYHYRYPRMEGTNKETGESYVAYPFWGYAAEHEDKSPYDKFIEWLSEFWEGPIFNELFQKYCQSEFERGLSSSLSLM